MPKRLVAELDRKGGNPFVPGLGKAIRDWKPDVIHGHAMARIAELCLLEDGTLLVLEREFSKVLIPRLRCRLYETDFSSATDVQGLASISNAPSLKKVEKRLLYETTGLSMYEGLCLGPKLSDGARLLVLVSDGDKKTFRSVMTLRLYPLAR